MLDVQCPTICCMHAPSPHLDKLGMLTLPSHIVQTACKRMCVRITES